MPAPKAMSLKGDNSTRFCRRFSVQAKTMNEHSNGAKIDSPAAFPDDESAVFQGGRGRRTFTNGTKRYPGDRDEARDEEFTSGDGPTISWMSASWSGFRETSSGSAALTSRFKDGGSSPGSDASRSRVKKTKKMVMHRIKEGVTVIGRKRHGEEEDSTVKGCPTQIAIEMAVSSCESEARLIEDGEDEHEVWSKQQLPQYSGMSALWMRQRQTANNFQRPDGVLRIARESDVAFEKSHLLSNDFDCVLTGTATLLDQLEIME